MTNGKFVSRVINDLRALNKDDHISRRHVLSVGRDKATYFLAQKMRDRSLYREDNLVSYIECFEMEPIESHKCDIVEFKNCKDLMVSTKKLPSLIYSRYGNSIDSITAIDNVADYVKTTPRKYRLDQKREYSKYLTNKFYYEKGSKLYLPDSTVELVNVSLVTLETEKLKELSTCSTNEECSESVWDMEFVISKKLEELVISETLKEFVSIYKQIIPDENPNMDETQKGKTTV